MKKIVSIILSVFLLLTILTSCDFVDSVINKLKPAAETTTAEPSTTTTEPSTTTTEPEGSTTTKPEDTSTEPEDEDITEPKINYGTLNNPVTTSYAYGVCAGLTDGESSAYAFFVKGKVTAIGSTGDYYKNVYITDGTTDLLIYTINMSDGITGFAVGDTIVAYGYIKNYQGTIEMATYNGSEYVYVIKVESAGGNQGGTDQDDTSKYLYTDFSAEEKALLNSTVGVVIPFIPNNEYYVEEFDDGTYFGISFYTFGNTKADFDAYRALFSSYTYDGSDEDDYGDVWYYYSNGDLCVDMSFYYYEDNYVVDIYIYTLSDGNEDITDPVEPEINYGTLSNPVSTTYAYSVCAGLAKGESSASPFYIKGTVTKIGSTGNYYKKVYFTDGTTELLIYTINMSTGITGFKVGDTIVAYGYVKNHEGTIEMATYNGSEFVYVVKVNPTDDSQDDNTSSYLYNGFTDEEKELFEDYFGFVIPFIPNDSYYVEEYTFEDEVGINFYTFDNTTSDFAAYRALFSSYTYDGTSQDDYGDTWYFYSKGNVYIDMAYYADEDGYYVVDVYVYIIDDDYNDSNNNNGDSGNTDADILTNEGAGLPQSSSGVYDVDFTKGEYVQNVTDQGFFIDGCPTVGSPAVLVIPVEFSDITAASKGYTIDRIESIFYGNNTSYYSVYDYFYISSYGKLDLDITVIDTWFRPAKSSSYYENVTYNYDGIEAAIGDQLIIDEALAYLATIMDLSQFDSDNNGMIDAIIIVNTLDIGTDEFHWAYRYWNYYTDANDEYYEYDGVSANDFMWVSYEFMFEEYDEDGNSNFDTTNPLNPYTFIHEFSHILGADDYYDTAYIEHPLDGHDMMDAMSGDHNPYTKFNYGWITTSKLIVTDGSVTVNLEAFLKNGDTIILANNWDESLGAYQEYYVIMYYTATELNDGQGGFFARDGILVYHVNASLYREEYSGEVYYEVYNTNTDPSGEYGTKDNLIEFVFSEEGNYTYVAGESLPTTIDDGGNVLGYTFVIDSITAEYATITFTKK